jgi:hypothetical protein
MCNENEKNGSWTNPCDVWKREEWEKVFCSFLQIECYKFFSYLFFPTLHFMKNELNFCFWYKVFVNFILAKNMMNFWASTRTLQFMLWVYNVMNRQNEKKNGKMTEKNPKLNSQLTADLLFNLTEFTLPHFVVYFSFFFLIHFNVLLNGWRE